MGNRLSKITTRTGDGGTTGLADGSRLSKNHPRIALIGDLDELNSHLGVLRAQVLIEDINAVLLDIQHHLFDIGGELALPGRCVIATNQLLVLDAAIATYNQQLPPLREFVLPGGNTAAAQAHVARSVCRRVERGFVGQLVELALNPVSVQYMNRLSDLLFVLARVLARENNGSEVMWRHQRPDKNQ